MKEKERNVDRIVYCSSDGTRGPAKAAAAIHALGFAGVAAGAATARDGTSMCDAGGRDVGRGCGTGGGNVGGSAPSNGDVRGGGSTCDRDVGGCDRYVRGLGSLDSAA